MSTSAVVNKQALDYRLLGKHDSQLLPKEMGVEDSVASEKFWKMNFGDKTSVEWPK